MPVLKHRFLLIVLVLVLPLTAGAYALDRLSRYQPPGDQSARPELAGPDSPDLSAPPIMTLPDQPRFRPEPDTRPIRSDPLLTLPGEFPTDGPGTFQFARTGGEVLGDSGPVRRFRVGVEHGVEETPTSVAAVVDGALRDRRGWTALGAVRFQRVPDGAGHDFTILLATSATTARLCAGAGLDVVGRGLPSGGVSCRTPGQVILNLSRWRQSVPHFVTEQVPLLTYRRMLVNHEVGHELGLEHQTCPGAGELAPVMQQQSLDLAGCRPNPWPYPAGPDR
jgi:hypothetical protein